MNRDEQKLRDAFERNLGDLKPSTPVETIRRGAKRGRIMTALASVVFVAVAGIGGYALTRTTSNDQDRVVGPGPKSEDGLIAFVTQEPGEGSLWIAVVPVSGGEATRLREGRDPAWSPDGTRIVFGCDRGICTMNPDGSEVVRLTDPGAPAYDEEPDWGPGGFIAFTRSYMDGSRGRDILMVRQEGGRPTPLLEEEANFAPSWSPDGRAIAFVRGIGPLLEAPEGGFQLWTMNADGTSLTRLTDDGAGRPDWSPDGQTILFDEASALFTIPADGGEPKKLPVVTANDLGSFPAWAPDSYRLAFSCQEGVCLSDVHAGELRVLVTNGGSPAWQPRVLPARDSAFQGLQPGWNELVSPPEPRTEAATVWAPTSSGAKLVMWGGYVGTGGSYPAEGFAWSEQTNSWDEIAASPIEPRAGAAGVFTGTTVIVWGGYGVGESKLGDGAAYDPETDTWRELPPAPIEGAIPLASVWTGQEVILWGSRDRDQDSLAGAAYNPASDEWRRLPDAPAAINEGSAAWTGDELIVFGSDLDGGNRSSLDHAVGMAYSPETDSWRELPDVDLSPQASAIAWTGERLIAWDYELQAASYDPEADQWEVIPKVPLEFSECYPTTEFVGSYVFAWFCGEAALWDVRTNAWSRIDTPGQIVPGDPVVAGEVVLFAGANHESQGNSMWAYAPPP